MLVYFFTENLSKYCNFIPYCSPFLVAVNSFPCDTGNMNFGLGIMHVTLRTIKRTLLRTGNSIKPPPPLEDPLKQKVLNKLPHE